MAHETEQYVIGDVRDVLATHPEVGELGLTVEVSGDKIFVTGSVATRDRCDAITRVLEQSFSDYEIHNETDVAEMAEPAEVEELT